MRAVAYSVGGAHLMVAAVLLYTVSQHPKNSEIVGFCSFAASVFTFFGILSCFCGRWQVPAADQSNVETPLLVEAPSAAAPQTTSAFKQASV